MLTQAHRNVWLMLLLLSPLVLQAQERAPLPPWYVGVKAAVVFTESDRPASNGKLLGFELGRRLTPKSALELELYHSRTDFDAGFGVDQNALKINYVLTNPAPLWHPYVLVGAGVYRYKAPAEKDTGLTIAVATGGQWDLNNNGLTLRVELRYRYSNAESASSGLFKKNEAIFSVGLTFPLQW